MNDPSFHVLAEARHDYRPERTVGGFLAYTAVTVAVVLLVAHPTAFALLAAGAATGLAARRRSA